MYARHLMTDPGAFVNGEIALVAAARSAGTVTPPIAIARAPQGSQLYEGATLMVQTGAATGTPDSFTVTCKVQTRASSSDSWADYKPDGITTAQVVVSAASTLTQLSINLEGAEAEIGVHTVVAFTGGTSPTIVCNAVLVLGGAAVNPSA